MFQTLTGELRDREFEQRYLAEAWARTRWQIRVVLGGAVIGVTAMMVANANDPALEDSLSWLLGARGLQLLALFAAITATFAGRRNGWIVALVALAEVVTIGAEQVNLALGIAP